MDKKILISAIVVSLIFVGIIWFFSSYDVVTASDKAKIFCEENEMELKKSYWNSQTGYFGECVKVAGNEIIETREISYLNSINDWRFTHSKSAS